MLLLTEDLVKVPNEEPQTRRDMRRVSKIRKLLPERLAFKRTVESIDEGNCEVIVQMRNKHTTNDHLIRFMVGNNRKGRIPKDENTTWLIWNEVVFRMPIRKKMLDKVEPDSFFYVSFKKSSHGGM